MAIKVQKKSNVTVDGLPQSLDQRIPNRFLLSVAVAKRAKQLKDGVKPLVPYNKQAEILPIETALEEISLDKIHIIIKEKKDAQDELLEEMDQLLEAEMEEAIQFDEEKKVPAVKEKVVKEKAKTKKSLGV